MKFYTKYDRPPTSYEVGGGKKLVETAGYLSAKQRIDNLITAGRQLMASRAEQYDFPEGTPTDTNFSDPTRSRGFDLADASQVIEHVEMGMRSSIEAKKADEDAKKAAQSEKNVNPAQPDLDVKPAQPV